MCASSSLTTLGVTMRRNRSLRSKQLGNVNLGALFSMLSKKGAPAPKGQGDPKGGDPKGAKDPNDPNNLGGNGQGDPNDPNNKSQKNPLDIFKDMFKIDPESQDKAPTFSLDQ